MEISGHLVMGEEKVQREEEKYYCQVIGRKILKVRGQNLMG